MADAELDIDFDKLPETLSKGLEKLLSLPGSDGKGRKFLKPLEEALRAANLVTEANTAYALRTGALPINMAHARKKARDALSPAVKEGLRKHLRDSYGELQKATIKSSIHSTITGRALLEFLVDEGLGVQVAYLHELEDLKEPDVFPLLLRFVASAGVWALNLGEIAFSAAQVEQLAHAADVGGVGFAFVENKYLQGTDGQAALRVFKDALWGVRRRRREQGLEPWLLTDGADPRQDRLIKSVRKMFWNPCSLERNKLSDAAKSALRENERVKSGAMKVGRDGLYL